MNPELRATLDKIVVERKRIKELELQMECAVLLEDLFPGAMWPVYTSILQKPESREFLFRIRDSNRAIKLMKIRDVPLLLLQRPHIQKACETNKALNEVVNGGIHGRKAIPHNSGEVENKE